MIYLCAQPDEQYFIWQLEILINNLNDLNVKKENIHILIAFNKELGVRCNMLTFARLNSDKALFFYYPDDRTSKIYVSTIRPHIIKQHYRTNPSLSGRTVFYHDSDIIITRPFPRIIDELSKNETVYVSDASSYVKAEYIDSKGSLILTEMCSLLGISETFIRERDYGAGGAQYIIKNVDYDFWDNVENSSLSIFMYLKGNEKRHKDMYEGENDGRLAELVNSWCADMWAILWNLYKLFEVKVHDDLAFCWPYDDQSEWENKCIFHNAGVSFSESDKLFFKSNYRYYAPFDKDFSFISQDLCSKRYVQLFKKYNYNQVCHYFENTAVVLFGNISNVSFGQKYLAHITKRNVMYLKDGTKLNSVFIKDEQEIDRVLFYNADYLVERQKLVGMQNVNRNEAMACLGYNINKISSKRRSQFLTDFDFASLDKDLDIDPIVYFHKFSSLSISRFLFELIVSKDNIIIDESLLNVIGYNVLKYGELVNIDENIKVDYNAV